MTRRIFIGHHFYGAGNLGDDLMLAGFLRAWHEWGCPAQLSAAIPFAPASQQRRFPEIAWLGYDRAARERAVAECDLWLGLGGPAFETDSGSWMAEHLAEEVETCRRLRKPMYFLCVGVSNREAVRDPRVRAALAQASAVWTRDEVTCEYLADSPAAGKVVPGGDLSQLCLSRHRWRPTMPGTVGWLLHFDDPTRCDPLALGAAMGALRDRDHHWFVQEVRRLPGSERVTYDELPSRPPLHVPDYARASVAQLLDAWPATETVVTSRFHGALIAAWRGARLVVAQRNDKLAGLARTLGCERLSGARDAGAIVAAVGRARPVERSLLEEQADKAWRCCAAFFREIRRVRRSTA